MTFQLTRPLRGVTRTVYSNFKMFLFQLTRPLRGVTAVEVDGDTVPEISTHTPLAGRDSVVLLGYARHKNFNSHAPCGA